MGDVTTFEDGTPSDRYTEHRGLGLLSGLEAVARLPIAQLRLDRAAGYNTASFLSGSAEPPIGGLDDALALAVEHVPDLPILLRPSLGPGLDVTAVMGSQLVGIQDGAKYEGVVGIWYGTVSGLARSVDAMRHANHTGTGRFGGAVAVVAEDMARHDFEPLAASEPLLAQLDIPVLQPADVQEVLDLGRHAVALSRLTGLWVGLKLATAAVTGLGTVQLALDRVRPISPDLEVDGVLHVPLIRRASASGAGPGPDQEAGAGRLEIARRYGVVNDLNRATVNPRRAWIGLVAAGPVHGEVVEALGRLGLDSPDRIEAAGIRLLKLQMPFPLDRRVVRYFAAGLQEVIVVEEGGTFIERAVRDALYGCSVRPMVLAGVDDGGLGLIPDRGRLTATRLVSPLHRRLSLKLGDRLHRPTSDQACRRGPGDDEGSCVRFDGGDLLGRPGPGTEGAQWLGMEPFLERDHLTVPLRIEDLVRSGRSVVRAAVEAGSTITYEVAYDAAAMTVEAGRRLPETKDLIVVLLAQGVTEVVVTTNDPARYDDVELPTSRHAGRTKVWNRARAAEARQYLSAVPGVSVLVRDWPGSARRPGGSGSGGRDRKPTGPLIDHRLCDGCEGEDDDACHQLDCASFRVVAPDPGGDDRARFSPGLDLAVALHRVEDAADGLPEPPERVGPDCVGIRLVGVDDGALDHAARVVATAAMMEGWTVRGAVPTETGPGRTVSMADLRLDRGESGPVSVELAALDVILGFDPGMGERGRVMARAEAERTVFVGFEGSADDDSGAENEDVLCGDWIDRRTRTDRNRLIDAAVATGPVAAAAGPELVVLGLACQRGAIPISAKAMERAIAACGPPVTSADGVGTEVELAAFRLGRTLSEPAGSDRSRSDTPGSDSGPASGVDVQGVDSELPNWLANQLLDLRLEPELHRLLARLSADLVEYQNPSYAQRFIDFMTRTVGAERLVVEDSTALSSSVATGLHRLMTYRDRYETARLLLRPQARAAAEAVGGPGATIVWTACPSALLVLGLSRTISPNTRRGRAVLSVLAGARRLRGTAFDPFDRGDVDELERSLAAEYEQALDPALHALDLESFDATVAMADSALAVRGSGAVRQERISEFRDGLNRGPSFWAARIANE